MKLKYFTKFLSALLFVLLSFSCNDTKTEYETTSASADALVYKFSLSATEKGKDSLNYIALKKTKFAIDLNRDLIYNPDSLPYQTTLGKFKATIQFAAAPPSKLELVYPKDSIVTWNGTDSINFSIPAYPRLRVIPANGGNPKEYSIQILIHQIDPNLMDWVKISNLQPSTINKQKTLLHNDIEFYTFSIDNDEKLALYKANKESMEWGTRQEIDGDLNGGTIILESLSQLKNTFFAIDKNNKAYSSSDGLKWTHKNDDIYSILGVLPGNSSTIKDSLLVVTKQSGNFYFAKTTDMQTLKIVNKVSNNPSNNTVLPEFPAIGFSAFTNYDKVQNLHNYLIITGGKDYNGSLSNHTWLLKQNSFGTLEIVSNQLNNTFPAEEGLVNFMYDDQLFALVQSKLYKSTSWGHTWEIAPDKDNFPPIMPKAINQSVIVDNENYIWIFGGETIADNKPVLETWKGRLNKFSFKSK